MSSNPSVLPGEEKKTLWILVWVKQIVMFLFPGIKLLKVNRQLKRVGKMYDHPYFRRQRVKNIIISFLASSPFILSTILAVFIIVKDERFMRDLRSMKNNIVSLEVSKATNQIEYIFRKNDYVGRMTSAVVVQGVGLALSFILGSLVLVLHPLLNDSKKLLKMLQGSGIVEKGDKNHLVLATPLGFLIDITGSTAREVKENDRIWMALNKRVNDWVEDPNERAIVFFKKAYQLKEKYVYNLVKETGKK